MGVDPLLQLKVWAGFPLWHRDIIFCGWISHPLIPLYTIIIYDIGDRLHRGFNLPPLKVSLKSEPGFEANLVAVFWQSPSVAERLHVSPPTQYCNLKIFNYFYYIKFWNTQKWYFVYLHICSLNSQKYPWPWEKAQNSQQQLCQN